MSAATTELTGGQRAAAQRRMRRYFWLNGIAVTCVLENVLLLWALRNGLSAPRVAVISSFAFLTMPFMLLGKHVSASVGLVRAWSWCWFMRYMFVLAMVPAPWLRGTALEPAISWVITLCCFALFAYRSMGMVNMVPLIGSVSEPRDVGSFQAGAHLRNGVSHLSSLALVMAVLSWRDEVGIYQWILILGSAVGFLSVAILRRTPEPDTLRIGARLSLIEMARTVAGKKEFRRLAWVWSGATTLIALTAPLGILAVKNGYGVADDAALGFTLIELIGGILAAFLISVMADHSGPRPLIILSMSLFLGTSGFWAFAPTALFFPGVAVAFLLAGIAKGALILALNHYLLATSTMEERFGVGLLMKMVAGITSGIAGMLIAGGLLRILTPYLGDGLPLYRTYYRIVLALTAGVALLTAVGLPRLKDWTVQNVIGLIFSFSDLRALMTLNQLRRSTSADEEAQRIDQLTTLNSRHSEALLREFIVSGPLVPQARAIRGLGRIRFGAATAQALIDEVERGAFINGWRAAELLGQRRVEAAIPALRAGLLSEDYFLCGKCMVALARLDDRDSFAEIRARFTASDNPRVVVHAAYALEIIRDPGDVLPLLNKCIAREWSPLVLDELLLTVASICGRKRPVYLYLKANRNDAPSASPEALPRREELPASLSAGIRTFLAENAGGRFPARLKATLDILIAHGG